MSYKSRMGSIIVLSIALISMILLLGFKNNRILAVKAIFIYLVAMSGPFFTFYYLEELNNRLKLGLPEQYFKSFLSIINYQFISLLILSLVTFSIALFLFLALFTHLSLWLSTAISIISAFPALGVGLRRDCFNDSSKLDDGIHFVPDGWGSYNMVESGYDPTIFYSLSLAICLVGFSSLLFVHSLFNGFMICSVTMFCYFLVIFPDKVNRFLPFDNRGIEGLVGYAIIIIIIFGCMIYFFLPQEFINVLSGHI